MTKILPYILCCSLLFTLSSCGSSKVVLTPEPNTSSVEITANEQAEKTPEITPTEDLTPAPPKSELPASELPHTEAPNKNLPAEAPNENPPNAEPPKPSPPAVKPSEVEAKMIDIQITAASTAFTGKLHNTPTAQAFIKKLPLTITMDELNGNEKFYYLSEALPTDSYKPSEIQIGNLMLYGSDCLVLFYEGFSTPYSYTRLGYIENVNGLAEALGSGNVQVTFTLN